MPEFAEWDSFYVIVGSSAGALIGLQFVVLTLIADKPMRGMAEASSAFLTPTIIHFSVVLLLSALVRVPWPSAVPAAIVWAVVALSGFAYTASVARRMGAQGAYRPQLEDWLFHAALPVAAYATLAISAVTSLQHVYAASFGVGTAVLVLLFCGIHNAWDAVAYHVFSVAPASTGESAGPKPPDRAG